MKQKIFGHRGASGHAPENTLEAFLLAAKMGADGVELDVQICRDGEMVVIHDETIERVSDGEGFVKDLTLKELKSLRFNKTFPSFPNAKIPTLSEVFEALYPTGLSINIELKNSLIDYPDLEERVVELVLRKFSMDRVLFSSFNHFSMLRMKALNPEFFCGLLYEASLVDPWKYAKELGMDALHPHYSQVITPGGFCKSAHKEGLKVNAWTINRPEEIRRCIREGTDILITNYPDLVQKEMEDPAALG